MVETMEIQAGFQKTEVGVIPSDWDVKKLADIADIDPENLSNNTNPMYRFNYISIEDVDHGILRNKTELLFKDAPSRARRRIRKDDVIVSTVRPNLKSHLLINMEVRDWICSTGFSVIRCKDDFVDSGFVFNHFFSSIINKQIENLISGSNYPAINSKDVRSLLIPLPPTKAEQTAIATALEDADAVITELEKLIAKKRNIKQGALQELLKPKEGWEVKKLGEIAEIKGRVGWKGYTKADLRTSGPLAIGAKHIDDSNRLDLNEPTHISYEKYLESPEIMVTFDDILIVQRGSIGKLALIDKQIGKATINPSMVILRIKNAISSYIYYQLISKTGQSQILLDTSSTGVPMISQKQIGEFLVPCPSLPEQTVISQILKDMDSEIEALEKKLEKYKMIKQGMMQNLLTGKIRLV